MEQMDQMQYQQQIDQASNKNIYDYDTNKNLYGIAFQNGDSPRLAISSLEKSLNNKIEILELIDNDLKNVFECCVEYLRAAKCVIYTVSLGCSKYADPCADIDVLSMIKYLNINLHILYDGKGTLKLWLGDDE